MENKNTSSIIAQLETAKDNYERIVNQLRTEDVKNNQDIQSLIGSIEFFSYVTLRGAAQC